MAPVWTRDLERGEKIEFLVPFQTPAMGRGTAIPIENQPGLGALALSRDADLLLRHTTLLSVPAGLADQPTRRLDVRVPTLGAYVINKALTFYDRPPGTGGVGSKRSKDLLYLRDIAAAGAAVVSRVETDLEDIVRSDSLAHSQIALVRVRLTTALAGDLSEVAEMLSVREGLPMRAAESDVRGYLTDLLESLPRKPAR